MTQPNRPVGFWSQVIVAALRNLGGEADTGDVFVWTEKNIPLTERELEQHPSDGNPRYRRLIHGAASKLWRDGSLIHVTHGRYRLP